MITGDLARRLCLLELAADAQAVDTREHEVEQDEIRLALGGLTEANLDVPAIQAHCREHLADYKVPKLIFAIDDLKRAPNGKPDYPFVTSYAEQQLNG